MRHNPFQIVDNFEETVADYCGSKYAVAVDCCTNALFLSCKYYGVEKVYIPSNTYISPAMSIINAGGDIIFNLSTNNWIGIYQLYPYPIYDAAKRFTSGMYIKGSLMCLSFHVQKHLKLVRGGMILTDDEKAYAFLRRARYEGRSSKPIYEDDIRMIGWNMYMNHQTAALGLSMMQGFPEKNEDLPNNYRDLRTFYIFKNYKVIDHL